MIDKNKYGIVVVTAKGWDGTRILGAFHTYEEAKKNILNLKPHKVKNLKEEIIIDFLNAGIMAKNMVVEFNSDPDLSKFESTFRFHEDI